MQLSFYLIQHLLLISFTSFLPSSSIPLDCSPTLLAQNSGQKTVSILLSESEVMPQDGAWANLYYGHDNASHCGQKTISIPPGGRFRQQVCSLGRTCEIPRRFRLKLKVESAGKASYFTVYFPSSNGFTRSGIQELDLGDLGSYGR